MAQVVLSQQQQQVVPQLDPLLVPASNPEPPPPPTLPLPKIYQAVVVGAGPAGIAAVGALLEKNIHPIHWVDPSFSAGRIHQFYREVPSNTRVRLITDFATSVPAFKRVWSLLDSVNGKSDERKRTSLQVLAAIDPNDECPLALAADVCLELTKGLRALPEVESTVGEVSEAETAGEGEAKIWGIGMTSDSSTTQVLAHRLFFCTGAAPTTPPIGLELKPEILLPLDHALQPSYLAKLIPKDMTMRIAVVGASHSAVLVLRNLLSLAHSTHPALKVKWLTKRALWYAEADIDGKYIARDNSGLKGIAARWARENLEKEGSEWLEEVRYAVNDEEKVLARELSGCDLVTFAVGYSANKLPVLRNGKRQLVVTFDHDTGMFKDVDGKTMKGLFGAGISYAEKVRDAKYGHDEMNIGFMGFMKAMRRWIADCRVIK